MYHKKESEKSTVENFKIPSEWKPQEENRWVIMSKIIPWEEFEEEYAKQFSENKGAPAKSFRMALGSLIIKEILGISDRETVEQIKENPYLQYFIGLEVYENEEAFDASMLVNFRQRIGMELVNQINKKMVKESEEGISSVVEGEKSEEEKSEGENQNRGKLMIDATCAPADIKYPTDIGILNEAREKTEEIIDSLHKKREKKSKKKGKKPRTYRVRARKDYLKLSKKRRPSRKERRKGIKKQIQYIERNLSHIEKMREDGAKLSKQEENMLLIIRKAYEQQVEMYENNENKVENRIVSLTQPHVRPIVRGKAGTPVEFGAKLSASYVNGYVYLYRLSWDNYNESGDFKGQVEEFKRETGYYPASVHADAIYRTRENRAFCKERGIRLSGPPLGRTPNVISPEKKKQALQDERERNAIEGKFAQAKRRFSLNRIMAKLPDTSETTIAITFLVINLSALLRQVLGFFCLFQRKRLFFCLPISPAYVLY
jgi:hypothetical protein